MPDWIQPVLLSLILVPVATHAVREYIAAAARTRRIRRAVVLDIAMGYRLFEEVANDIAASASAFEGRKVSRESGFDEIVDLVASLHSGFVIEEPMIDASFAEYLSSKEAAPIMLSLDHWRRFIQHEKRYSQALDHALELAGSKGHEGVLREQLSRAQGELARLVELRGRYSKSARETCEAVVHAIADEEHLDVLDSTVAELTDRVWTSVASLRGDKVLPP